jgi:hypothetical protein
MPLVLQFLDFEMIFYTSKSTFISQVLIFSMPQCAARQFENELVERLLTSVLANPQPAPETRHLRPEGEPDSTVELSGRKMAYSARAAPARGIS